MKRGKPLRRTGTLKRGAALRRGKPAKVIEADLWRDGMANRCAVCKREAKLTGGKVICGGRVQAHHIIAQQALKRRGLHDRLLDHRNRLAVCTSRHERHTDRREPIPRALLPGAAWEFAAEVGLEWMLEKTYPLVVCEDAA